MIRYAPTGRRAMRAACVASAALLSIVGCSSPRTPTGSVLSGNGASAPRGSLTVWSWNIAAKALQERIPAFEKRTPSVRVTVDMTGARMSTRLMLSLAAGVGAPDVSQLQISEAPYYIATRRLADLTPVAAKYKAMFPAAQWESCTLDGKVYAIPWDTGPCAVFYKRDIFAKYGIDPARIETWDDYIRAGETILKKSGGRTRMLPLGSNDLEAMFEILLQQTGGQIFDTDGRLVLDSPEARQALGVIRRIRTTGIHSDVAAYSQEWMAGFADDSIASYPGAVWLAGTLKDTAKDAAGNKTRWGVFRLPAVTRGGLHVANSGGSVLVIPASCPNKAAAWSFIEYVLCTSEGQLAQYRTSSLYPSFLPALESPVMDEPDPMFDGQPIGRLFATDITKIARLNRTRDWSEATGYIRQGLSHWASEGMTDDAVLAQLTQKLGERLNVPVSAGGNPGGETR